MRVAPDTSIHDLTDAEAVELRALVDLMMLRGPDVPPRGVLSHDGLRGPLYTAWLDVAYPRRHPTVPPERFAYDFLPMALHALLRRADRVEPLVVDTDELRRELTGSW